jgi:hypothetical protein
MRAYRLKVAIREAKRFLQIAEECEKEIDPDARNEFIYPSRQTASVKRASMDLTSALVDIRKGDYTK